MHINVMTASEVKQYLERIWDGLMVRTNVLEQLQARMQVLRDEVGLFSEDSILLGHADVTMVYILRHRHCAGCRTTGPTYGHQCVRQAVAPQEDTSGEGYW